jgi:hypothetical protein
MNKKMNCVTTILFVKKYTGDKKAYKTDKKVPDGSK